MLALFRRFLAFVVALVFTFALGCSGASAQDANSAAAAEALFREGRQLMDARRYAEACEKFQASYELDVALGTLLNLANCYELDGQLASAWARFIEAETMARRASDTRGLVARDRAAALEPRLVRVRVVVRHRIEGLRVTVDGREFAPASWGSAIPIDPGDIVWTATAPGYQPHVQSIHAETEGTTVDVEVPPLVAAPESDAELDRPPPETGRVAPPEPEPDASHGRAGAWALGGAGVGSLVAGVALGVSANSLWDPSACPVGTDGVRRCPTAAAQDDAEAAKLRANLSTGLFVAGGVFLTAGTVWLIATRRDDDDDEMTARISVVPVVQPNGAGLVVGGSF
jgi:hypothetical protein